MATSTSAEVEKRHILSLSGGKDSAALAIYMRDKITSMEYIFHDTDKELPETYEYLARLEALLGRKVQRTTSDQPFDKWLKVYGNMIPSNRRRWCTRQLKLKPFERYVGDDVVYNYIGLRADEDRQGYISHRPNIIPVYPFREAGIGLPEVHRILEDSGLGLPKYTGWGRTRSGCFFCFYQQKIEWVRLKERYPELYREAKAYEVPNKINGNVFYWNDDESLEDLERPERVEQITRSWQLSQERRVKRNNTTLLQILVPGNDLGDEETDESGCLICQL